MGGGGVILKNAMPRLRVTVDGSSDLRNSRDSVTQDDDLDLKNFRYSLTPIKFLNAENFRDPEFLDLKKFRDLNFC